MKKIFLICLFIFVFTHSTFSQPSELRKKIGQMIMVGYSGKYIPISLKDDLQKRYLGGVVYFAANIVNPTQLKALSDSLKLLSQITPFVAIDQEGGKVARLGISNGYEATYTAYKLGTLINNEDTTLLAARKMASWLKGGGVNVNLAPVVDVNVNSLSPAIGKYERSFSQFPEDVFKHSNCFISEFNTKNIISALKHFPGHGSAKEDSHFGFTDISNTWSEAELIPYQKLIDQGYNDFIMSGHLYNNKLDSIYPASLSKNTLTDLLRNKLLFKGPIITDELFMQAITKNYNFDQTIELAVNAGNDILLFSTNIHNNGSLVEEVINLIEQKISEGKIPLSRIEESYNRIIKLKTNYLFINSIVKHTSSEVPKILFLTNYPNPFNPNTTIEYHLPKSSFVSLKIYDLLGRELETIIAEEQRAGNYKTNFEGKELPSGIYICLLKAGEFTELRKMFLAK